jgi:hypothetical protein
MQCNFCTHEDIEVNVHMSPTLILCEVLVFNSKKKKYTDIPVRLKYLASTRDPSKLIDGSRYHFVSLSLLTSILRFSAIPRRQGIISWVFASTSSGVQA